MHQKELRLFDERRILSVSELVHSIKLKLEGSFSDLWVRGEISNLRTPPSGHHYFTLKDADAQLRAVCFRMQNQLLKFKPQDGMDVLARGSLSVYPPRGETQLVVDLLEPMGPGALQVAFEQLKTRLASEGLFEQALKKPLPLLPARIGVVTSPSGAAIQDILRVLERRNDRVGVLIFPAPVQGSQAPARLAEGIRYFNTRQDIDVIMLARGGGSLEDLWCFNDENLARAIFESQLPVISAVGHEIDVTIADFVADLRAPTPSAAAELVSGARKDLEGRLEHLTRRAAQAIRLLLNTRRIQLRQLSSSRAFVHAESRLRFFLQRLDELQARLLRTVPFLFAGWRQRLQGQQQGLDQQIRFGLKLRRQKSSNLAEQLQAYSPLAVLERGYAIVTDNQRKIVRKPGQVAADEPLNVRVQGGEFRVRKI